MCDITVETCILSKEAACAGSPHWWWSPQPVIENTVVCGSPHEIANTPDAPALQTNTYQFQSGK